MLNGFSQSRHVRLNQRFGYLVRGIVVQRHTLHDRVLIPNGEAFFEHGRLSAFNFDIPRVDEMDAFMCELPDGEVGVVLCVSG